MTPASDSNRLLPKMGHIRRPIGSAAYRAASVLTFIGVGVAWFLLVLSGWIDAIFLPSPVKVIGSIGSLWESGRLVDDISVSVWRVTAGFLLAALLAIPLGILMGTFQIAEALLQPMMNFIRYMPAAAFIPLLMLYVGIDEGSKVSVIFIGTFFQLILMVAAVVRNVPMDMIKVSYTLGATRRHALLQVIVPASLPGIIDSLRLTLGWAWTYVVVAELVAADQGLGFRIMESQRFLKTEVIFLYIFIIGLLGLLFDYLFRRIEKGAVPWAEGFK